MCPHIIDESGSLYYIVNGSFTLTVQLVYKTITCNILEQNHFLVESILIKIEIVYFVGNLRLCKRNNAGVNLNKA